MGRWGTTDLGKVRFLVNRKTRMRGVQRLFRLAIVAGLGVFLWHYFAGLDLSLAIRRISEGGFPLLFVLLPYGLIILAESIAWRLTIRRKPGPEPGRLCLIRMATDAILYSVPGGVALAEPMRPVLLQKACGIELTEGIGSCIITKINIAVAQVLFIVVGFILVALFYPGVGVRLGMKGSVAGYVLGSSAMFCALGLLVVPLSGSRLSQLVRLVSRIRLAPVQRYAARIEPAVHRLDQHVGRFAREHTLRFAGSLLLGFAAWLLIALETYLILTILGAEPTFTQAIALESVASIVRIVFFFIPSGLGASEVGFVTLMLAFGFPHAVTLAAAYIGIKRLKEVCWVALGLVVLWFVGINPFRRARAVASGMPETGPTVVAR
jgi:uncharacterized protein (TIRG00374 family)